MAAHVPLDEDIVGQNLATRDYFQGAKRQAGAGAAGSSHVSKVYRGTTDSLYKFAISAPVLDGEGKFQGVIAASVTTNATMGLVALHDVQREVALVAPRDPDARQSGFDDTLGDYIVLFHPAYRYGVEPVAFPNTSKLGPQLGLVRSEALRLVGPDPFLAPEDDYRDAVAAVDQNYAGRWIAGFAPVGNTGFIVVVQQRFEDAVSLDQETCLEAGVVERPGQPGGFGDPRNSPVALDAEPKIGSRLESLDPTSGNRKLS